MEKKRFILFGFDNYYPGGGMNDRLITFDTLDELISLVAEDEQKNWPNFDYDGYQVFDTKYFKVGRGGEPTIAFSNLSSK